eukprot:6183090-Pleurochrysis_carterae.AAC.1
MPLSQPRTSRCSPLAARRLALSPFSSPAPCAVPPVTTGRHALSPSQTSRRAPSLTTKAPCAVLSLATRRRAPFLTADVDFDCKLRWRSAKCDAHYSCHPWTRYKGQGAVHRFCGPPLRVFFVVNVAFDLLAYVETRKRAPRVMA